MFEKEAEEYVCGLFPSVNVFASGRLIQAFKDGAKFGYNKAKEEHAIKTLAIDCSNTLTRLEEGE